MNMRSGEGAAGARAKQGRDDGFRANPEGAKRDAQTSEMSERQGPSTAVDHETEITLGLLSAVEENAGLTQRSAARQLGIALGLTNAYLKRCIKKGLIKVKQIPPNRYAYYLTPKGFAEKSRLTADYLSGSFTFFRRARSQCDALLADCAAHGRRRIALYGVSDLAEIAVLCAGEHEVDLVGVVDEAADRTRFFDLPVVSALAQLGPVDAVLITDLKTPQASFGRLTGALPLDRILTPRMLRVSRPEDGATARTAP